MSMDTPVKKFSWNGMILPNYEIVEKLGESPQSAVYKGYSAKKPDAPLAIKILKVGALSDLQKIHFRQKIEHLKVLNDPALLRPLTFEITRGVQFITSEHFEGIPLNAWAGRLERVSLNDFFTLSCQLASSLAKVHEAGIIHGSVKPHNLLVEPKRLSVRLIDFMTALDIREVSHFIYDMAFVKDTLAYTSPEQTGRINHRVDFTTDLYSLGVVFYELLTGRLPFFSLDPLELIHSHLAEEARAVHELNPRSARDAGRDHSQTYPEAAGEALPERHGAAGRPGPMPPGVSDHAKRGQIHSRPFRFYLPGPLRL